MSPKHVPPHTTVPLTRNPAAATRGPRAGPAAYARAARRYNIDTPVFFARDGVVFKRAVPFAHAHTLAHRLLAHAHTLAHRPRAPAAPAAPPAGGPASEVPAQDIQNDVEYVVSVRVGTPGVALNLDFDTGSSDLWVWSSELRSAIAGHTIYDPNASSTAAHVAGATWNITYGDGSSASGNVYTDTIHIGALAVRGQAVELAQKLSSSFLQEGGSDGLLGLAWPSINTVQPTAVLTPVANMLQQGVLGVFSVALDQGDGNGFYTFGGTDAARAGVQDSDIAFTPVDNSQGFWMFESAAAEINGHKITQRNNTAILDTGTTLLLAADATVRAVYAAIPGARMDQQQGGWVYPADAQVPAVSFAVGDTLYAVPPAAFAFGDAGDGMTFGGIQSRGNNPFDILGDVFLKGVYAVFDEANVQVGVAQRAGNVV